MRFEPDFTISNCYFENNDAEHAVISSYAGKTTIKDSNFTLNKNTILNLPDDTSNPNVLIENVNFISNDLHSKGISVNTGNGKSILKNSNFINNKVQSALLNQYGNQSDIINCNFTNNIGALIEGDSNIDNCNFINTTSPSTMISINANYIRNSMFKNNKIINTQTTQTSLVLVGGKINVLNCIFTNNTAPYGGAIYWMGDGKIDNCTFSDNNAKIAGAIFVAVPNLVLSNDKFINNKATSYNDVYGYFSLDLAKTPSRD